MDAAPASRRSVELSAMRRGWSKGLTSDHRGTRRAVMIEFYTTVGQWQAPGSCLRSLGIDPFHLCVSTSPDGTRRTGVFCGMYGKLKCVYDLHRNALSALDDMEGSARLSEA
jgi:hypothetical protein